MSSGQEALMCYIRRLAALPPGKEVTDAALLDRFIAGRDEQAFTALLKRHGAMVLQVCWRILGNGAHAEDAFQATFLVLARKAAAVQPREALPAWLHGVARRVALKARAARIRCHESGPLLEAPADGSADPLAELSARELLAIVDEEVQRLPERYRLPIILCCLEGRSLEEAARQLGWTSGSVKGRLERGRERLHNRLVRRGLTLSAALAAVEVSRVAASAAVLARLLVRLIPGALAFGAGQGMVTGVSTSAAVLAGRVVMAMALPRLIFGAALLLITAALGAGIALRGNSPEPATPTQDSSPRAAIAALRKPIQHPPVPFWDQSDVPIDIGGQVLDPHGKPLAGADLYVGYSVRRFVRRFMPETALAEQTRPGPYPRRATTGTDGRFHFRFATSELDPNVLDNARPAVMAVAAGYGPEWAEISQTAASDLKLQLVDDLPVTGRVLDPDQNPIAGAKVVVQGIYSAPVDELTRFLNGNLDGWAPRCWNGPLPGSAPTILTGADGRWHCSGLGRDRIALFALEGPQVPRTFLNMATKPGEIAPRVSHVHGPAFDYLAPPVHTVRGAVRDQGTRKPIAGVKITVIHGNATSRTGPDGQFEIVDYSKGGGYGLVAQPEADQGYFAGQGCVREQAGVSDLTLDLFLVRGVALSGKVTNHSTGKPPKAAVVEYYPLVSNPQGHRVTCVNLIPASTAKVRPDGSYSLTVLPGPGVIGVVASPREDYAVADITKKEWVDFLRQQPAHFRPEVFPEVSSYLDPCIAIALGLGHPGRLPINKYHALTLIDPPEKALNEELDIPLRTAQTAQGTVLGPNGQPLTGVTVVGLTAFRDISELLEGASFTVTGLNPQGSRQLFFQHRAKKLGKVVTVQGNAAQPMTVQLEPCGTAIGRMLDEHGNAMPGAYVILSEDDGPSYAMAQTDNLGRFQMALFPGQKYTWGRSPQLSKELGTVQVDAGQVRDLGDLAKKAPIPRPKIPGRRP
ncbi:MAG TPA: sigma-70 family RNA polymerase sigma factor [Gemmataceae bacterium]|jgi:RNA polymerase sigma factor (sigma-70 family)|nr:sigma-70 family RNA polymerase sigma factor [Gemmataceae bacterium]